MKYATLISLICIFTFFSCEKEIPLNETDIKPRIVVNSIFSDGDTCSVHLSESRNVLYEQSALPNITNATVQLFDVNDILLGTFNHTQDGIYELTSFLPSAGNTYKIKASANGFEPVSATSSTPSVINLTSIDTTTAVPNDRIQFDLSFQDNPTQDNYYSISIVQVSGGFDPFTGEFYGYENPYFSTNEIYVDNGSQDFDGENYAEEFFFSDALFNGELLEFQCLHDYYYSPGEVTIYYIKLNSLSEDLYKYKLSYSKYSNSKGDIFAEPVQVYSNIDQGFGVFGGFSSYTDSVIVQ